MLFFIMFLLFILLLFTLLYRKENKQTSTVEKKTIGGTLQAAEPVRYSEDTANGKANPTTSFNIEDIEKALIKYKGTTNEETVLEVAGEAYLWGKYGAQVNYKKAVECYKRWEEIGNIKGIHFQGVAHQVIGLQTGDFMYYSLGTCELYKAYKGGCELSEGMLRDTFESGFFENVSTFEEGIEFCKRTFDQ